MSTGSNVVPAKEMAVEQAKFLVPTPGRLIVQRDEFKYGGLIYVPDKHRQLPTTGIVVAVGDDDKDFLLGKRVAWARFSGTMLHFSGMPKYDVLAYEEILAYVTDEKITIDMESLAGLNRED